MIIAKKQCFKFVKFEIFSQLFWISFQICEDYRTSPKSGKGK